LDWAGRGRGSGLLRSGLGQRRVGNGPTDYMSVAASKTFGNTGRSLDVDDLIASEIRQLEREMADEGGGGGGRGAGRGDTRDRDQDLGAPRLSSSYEFVSGLAGPVALVARVIFQPPSSIRRPTMGRPSRRS
jgi:hypothetical protein